MANSDTTNATTMPNPNSDNSYMEMARLNFNTFNKLAPSMMGMLMKNENSVATKREVPTSIPPMIVEPEREVPGTNDNT